MSGPTTKTAIFDFEKLSDEDISFKRMDKLKIYDFLR